MIYLDEMGHCYSDVSLDELYDFCVVKLSLRPEWNHYSRDFPHFDIRGALYRSKVLALGAISISNREMVRLVRRGSSPYKTLRENAGLPIYDDVFRGKPIKRVDFAKYFAKTSQ